MAVLGLGAVLDGLDLSTRRSRAYALVVSLVLGVGFYLLADAWMGLCFPAAILILILSGLARDTRPLSVRTNERRQSRLVRQARQVGDEPVSPVTEHFARPVFHSTGRGLAHPSLTARRVDGT